MPEPSHLLALGTPAPQFALPDTVSGRTVSLADLQDAPALVIAFVCNHCPYVQHLLDGLVAFGRDMEREGVAVVAISSNDASSYPADAPAEMRRIATGKGFAFPYLYDESQSVARAYGAVCTPDFFVYDAARRLAYHGQFDASRPGNKVPVTGADLRAAVAAVRHGTPLPRSQIASVGCTIKWKRGQAPNSP
ncbi:MAG: thioredoxin family protein [Gammaproteobacteria bacterium]|nr:thioredoxin family protein [Gammaproteobacteria bacterium]MBV9621427.1 thioredoxin family protein [Gammaproteobacteria bacterium]